MYDFFKNIIEKNSCKSEGICSIHPSIVSLNEILLNEIREISFYLVKLKEFGLTNANAMNFCIEILSIFLINTNYNKKKYLNLFEELNSKKLEIKTKYLEHCSKNKFPCEIINSENNIEITSNITKLIKQSELNITNKQKNADKTKQRLFELITIYAKLCAINITKIKNYDKNFNSYDYEILRFFALTNGYSIRNEKIIRRIKEFCKISKEIRKQLYEIEKTKYKEKQNTKIMLNPCKGQCILVSGNDLNELEKLLKTLEESDFKEKINVYTNGNMLKAHLFPYFQQNQFLKGHIESDDIQYDFTTFPGSILITKNFIQKIDSLYRGQIFSNKTISFDGFFDIKNNDYLPLIKSAFELEGFKKNFEKKEEELKYDTKEANKIIKNLENNDEILIILGNKDKNINEYSDKKIIYIECPCETDILIDTLQLIKEKNISASLFFTHCNLESLETIFSLLNEDIKLYLNDCYFVLINPHVIESLKEDFNVEII